MPTPPEVAAALRAAVVTARQALTTLAGLDDPSLWSGPAARRFDAELAHHLFTVRRAVGAADAAAAELEAADAAGG